MSDKPLLTVSVDFDGTITKSPDPDSPDFNVLRPYCKELMTFLNAVGVKFYLLTGRKDEYTQEAIDLCKEWELPIDFSNPHRKIVTDVYIDDKNLECTEVNWWSICLILYSRVLYIKAKNTKESKK